jgi:hypothetical protein
MAKAWRDLAEKLEAGQNRPKQARNGLAEKDSA